jgi:hypothetical protein
MMTQVQQGRMVMRLPRPGGKIQLFVGRLSAEEVDAIMRGAGDGLPPKTSMVKKHITISKYVHMHHASCRLCELLHACTGPPDVHEHVQ